jgi:acetylornithine deacetylase/succinyl-diaminopimelate desuccinylase-like protein
MGPVEQFLRSHRKQHLTQLVELLRIPSVSTDSQHSGDVKKAADWVRKRLREAGCSKSVTHKTAGHPIVYGEWLGAAGAPTVLVYGHYDVQPVDPVALWDSPPFEPTIKDDKIYARGASDDKGQFIIHVNALEAHLTSTGACPVNVKFLIEGEEEIGSPSLEAFIKENKALLACDSVVVSDTAMYAKNQPSICYGLRGMAYFEIEVQGTNRDLHSGVFGGAVVNPANALTQMLASLKDTRGKITIPGFYDKVVKMTTAERKMMSGLPYSDRKYKSAIGAPELFGEKGYTTLERVWGRPSLDINGIWSGFTGEGAKTVIPAKATAKVSMRLVPDQTPKEIGRLFKAHLKKIAPDSVKIDVRELHGGEPWVAPTDHPALQAAGRAMKKAFGKAPVFVREGGSIPVVATFDKLLDVPSVLMGIGLVDDNLHAPNEKLDLDNFYRGMIAAAVLMDELGTSGTKAPSKRRAAAKKLATEEA